jgi:hypothetical protein
MTRTADARIAGVTYLVLVFELTLAVWPIVKGVEMPARVPAGE